MSDLPSPPADQPGVQPLLALHHAVAAEEPLPSLLQRGVRAASDLVRCHDVFVYVVDTEIPARPLALRARLREGTGAASADLESAALAAAQVALRHDRPAPSGLHPVVLDAAGKPLGVLVATRGAEGEPFTPEEVLLLRAVADALTIALQSAALFTRQQHRMRELSLLSEVANDCASGLDRVLPTLTERVYRALNLRLSLLMLLDTKHNELVWGWGFQSGHALAPSVKRFPVDGGGFGVRTVRTRQPVRATPAEIEDVRMRALAERDEINHFAAVPLLVQERPVGIFIVGRKDAPIEDDELRLLMAIGVQIGVAADNTRLLAETRQHAADMTLIQQIGAAMAHSLDPNAILQEAVVRLNAAMSCDGVRLYKRNGTMFELATREGSIPGAATTAMRLPQETDAIRRAFAAGRAIDVVVSTVAPPLQDELNAIGVVRLAIVPLWITLEDRTESSPSGSFGLLTVVRQTNRPFSTPELGVLDAVGVQLAIAFRNAELHDETKRQAEDLSTVNEAGRALLGGEPLTESLEKVGTAIARLARVPHCALFLVDQERRLLRGKVKLPDGTSRAVSTSLDSDSVVACAVHSRRPCPEPGSAFDSRPVADGVPTPPWAIALPLQSQDKVLGVALLMDQDAGRVLSRSEVARVMAVGNQVAIAIDRASLHAQLQQSIIQLEQTQRQLVQRERLAALGGLSAQVAHEIRNPLGVVTNSLGLLAKLTDLQGDARRVYGIMQEEVRRLDEIVNHMLDYTRPMEARLAPTDLSRVLRDALASAQAAERLRGTAVDSVQASIEVAPELPPIPLDERLMHQALVNLLTNAYHALNGKGSIRLQGSLDPAGQRVRISIQDTGPGVPEEVRWRIFEPFFTTKAKGSGLGLAIVKRIVETQRGEISLDSTTGQGTRFSIFLPMLPEPRQGHDARPRAGVQDA